MKFHNNLKILKIQNLQNNQKSRKERAVPDAAQADLLQAARHPAAPPSAAELLPGALASEGMARLERLLGAAARASPGELRGAAEALIGAGGKRVRPLLVMLSARAAGEPANGVRRSRKGRVALALAAELIHSATLLHDDVIDDGLTRRGLPAPRVVYGNSISVLTGDWMLTEALEMARRSRAPGALEALTRALRELVAGEARQLKLRGDASFTAQDARWVARMKTGALFGFCAEAGGLAARASPGVTSALREFGLACGTAFQISDDLLDFRAAAPALGKAVLADVAEGKASLPVALALEEQPALRAELRALLEARRERGADDEPGLGPVASIFAARARSLAQKIAATSALARARLLAEQERDAGLAALARLPASPTRELLELVARLLLDRDK